MFQLVTPLTIHKGAITFNPGLFGSIDGQGCDYPHSYQPQSSLGYTLNSSVALAFQGFYVTLCHAVQPVNSVLSHQLLERVLSL